MRGFACGGGSLLGSAFLRQAMLSAWGDHPTGHVTCCDSRGRGETASALSRDN